MSAPAFTPGPWTVESGGVSSKDGYADVLYVAEGHVYSEYTADSATLEIPNHANALLIAAAPELYYALDHLLHRVPIEPESREAFARASAALAKARGDQ